MSSTMKLEDITMLRNTFAALLTTFSIVFCCVPTGRILCLRDVVCLYDLV